MNYNPQHSCDMKGLILAGGFGKRLAPLTQERPKPLLEVAGRPIIEWQIEWLKRQGIRDVVVAVGYLRGRIFEEIGDGRRLGVRVMYSVEEEPLGTGGAIKNAEPFLDDDTFVVLNGDIITDIEVGPMAGLLRERGAVGVIALVPLRSPYGVVEVDEGGNILSFREKPLIEGYLINAGIYVFSRSIFKYLPERGNIEETAFPALAGERLLLGYTYRDAFWKSIDTVKDLEEANKALLGGK